MPDEPNLGGGASGLGAGVGSFLRNVTSGFRSSSSASATLNFDIGGLTKFREEVGKARTSIKDLNTAFTDLARGGPKAFATMLEQVNKQLVDVNKNMGLTKTGVGGSRNVMSSAALPPGGTGTGGGGGPAATTGTAAGGAAAAATGQAIGQAITTALGAMFNRFEKGAALTASADTYLSRMAVSTGTTSRNQFGRLAVGINPANAPLLGSLNDVSQTMYNLSQQGYVAGGTGLAGQRGGAALSSARMLQALSPGLGPQEAGSIVAGSAANVAAQRQGIAAFGSAAMAYTQGGQLKPLNQRFQEVLSVLQQRRGGNKAGQPFTKDELTASQIPGSTMHSWLAQLGWDDAMTGQFFTYAIAAAQYGPGFEGTERQMERLRGGKSLATAVQETTTAQAGKDAKFGAEQYKALVSQQEMNQKMIRVLSGLDSTLKSLYGLAGKLPSGVGPAVSQGLGNLAGGIIGGVGSYLMMGAMIAGDPPGLSQVNPDVRGRVGNMMAANPNLRVASGFRSHQQQKNLYESGNPFAAPPGKSQHGRGRAVDLGPASQYGWIMRNAKRFGLDHAASQGEPWHVQLAGTVSGIGDIDVSERDDWASRTKEAQRRIVMGNLYAEGTRAASGSAAAATTPASGGAPATGGDRPTGPTSGKVPLETVVQALYRAGFRGDDLVNMAAIPSRESGYIADRTNLNANTKDQSYGLWQINVRKDANYATAKDYLGGSEDWSQLFDPYKSAELAYIMYQRSGNTLRPWGGYKGMSNTYGVGQDAIDAARAEVTQLYPTGDVGYGGGGVGGGGSSNVAVTHQPVTFQNTFHVAMGAGGGNTDIDNLVRQIAAKLEPQLRRMQTVRH